MPNPRNFHPLSVLACLAVVATWPVAASAQDAAVAGQLLEVVSHQDCTGDGAMPSFVTVEGATVPVSLSEPGATPVASERPTIKVRRGSDVTEARIGFRSARPAASDAPKPQQIDLTLDLRALVCQRRTSATVAAGTWSLRGSNGDMRLLLEGVFPSGEAELTQVRFTPGSLELSFVFDVRGELLAESSRQLELSAEPVVAIALPEG